MKSVHKHIVYLYIHTFVLLRMVGWASQSVGVHTIAWLARPSRAVASAPLHDGPGRAELWHALHCIARLARPGRIAQPLSGCLVQAFTKSVRIVLAWRTTLAGRKSGKGNM
jgi:hypothetical protein